MSIELDLLVLSPGGLNPDALPFVPQGFKPGVRVVNLSFFFFFFTGWRKCNARNALLCAY